MRPEYRAVDALVERAIDAVMPFLEWLLMVRGWWNEDGPYFAIMFALLAWLGVLLAAQAVAGTCW